jgi:hypothetical protein
MKDMDKDNSPTVRFFQGTRTLSELPPRSVALDGAVRGPVLGDEEDRWSFDHHDDCGRLVTAATCEQVYTAIALGMDISEREVWVNDLDGDTVLSIWLLRNPEYVIGGDMNARSLVRGVALLDAHGPAGYRLMNQSEKKFAEAFFSVFRDLSRPGYAQQRFAEWPALVEDAMQKIWEVYIGKIRARDPEPATFAILYETPSMCLARATGFGAFEVLYNKGYKIVGLCSEGSDGSTIYTIGKISDLVRYPLGPGNKPGSLLGRLNAREPGWGGGSSIGGSPRLPGGVASRLTPEEIWQMMHPVEPQ